jgi:hypothetical protein
MCKRHRNETAMIDWLIDWREVAGGYLLVKRGTFLSELLQEICCRSDNTLSQCQRVGYFRHVCLFDFEYD